MGALEYIKETRAEMRHVTWPTRSQVVVFTFAVIGMSIIAGIYLGLFDFVFTRGLEAALERFGVDSGIEAEQAPSVDSSQNENGGIVPEVPGSSLDTPAFDPEAILEGGALPIQ